MSLILAFILIPYAFGSGIMFRAFQDDSISWAIFFAIFWPIFLIASLF